MITSHNRQSSLSLADTCISSSGNKIFELRICVCAVYVICIAKSKSIPAASLIERAGADVYIYRTSVWSPEGPPR